MSSKDKGRSKKELVPTDALENYYRRLTKLYKSGIPHRIYDNHEVKGAKIFNTSRYEVTEIPVDFASIQRFYIKKFKKGLKTPKHVHDSPSFRYVLSGKIKINSKTYSPGDWVFVPRGVPYSFEALKDSEAMEACNHGTLQQVLE